MRILRGAPNVWNAGEALALAVGVFDGVHVGHHHVLQLLLEAAEIRGLKPAVLTFDPHPLSLIAPHLAPRMLTTIDQRIEQFAALGVELTAVLAFDASVRGMSAEAFIEDILVARLRAEFVVAGQDFRFGADRSGDLDLLAEMGSGLGFETVSSPLIGGEEPVSSTRIREALDAGDIPAASALLGRDYQLVGAVVPGVGRGSGFGVATANVDVDATLSIPGRGVYAVRAGVGELVPAVANIGVRPTFGVGVETVEVHLIDRYVEIIGDAIRIEFVARLRDEQAFAGISELVDQIGRDIEAARAILAKEPDG
ncbi:MAG: riboflavin biosynthesis protein RibF [Acidimicrobiia bacterium]